MNYFDPVSLKLFVAVCEEHSLSLAAERECIAASAVSKRLAALEDQIGSKLIKRGRRGIELTAAGLALLPGAREQLESMRRLHAQMSEYAKGVHGHVRVAASMSAIAEFLPDDIAAFITQYDTVRVVIDERLSPEVVRSVEEGRADIGVCWDAVSRDRLESVPYRADHMVVVAHREHALASRRQMSFAETLAFEHVSIHSGSIVQLTQQQRAAAAGEGLRYRVQVTTFEAACRIVAAKLAIAVVPQEACRPSIKVFGLRAIRLTDDWALRRFVVCMQDRKKLAVPARLLVEALAAQWHGARD